MAILSILLLTIIIITSILLVLIVLVQRPKQEGLGAAFGGGAFDSALGAHTTDILQKFTTYLATVFFVCAIGLAMVKSRQFDASPAANVLQKVEQKEAEAAMPTTISDQPASNDLQVPTLLDDIAVKKEGAEPAGAEDSAPAATEESTPPAEKESEAKAGETAPADAPAPKESPESAETPASEGDTATKSKGGE